MGESRGLALGFSRFFSFGPTVTPPLFDGGRLRANVKIQEARQQQTVIRHHQVVLQSLEEVENALVACAREQERQQALVAATEASKKAVDLANQLYSHGVGDFLAVLEAQESLYSSEDQLVRSQRNAATNLIGLYKALGGAGSSPTSFATQSSSQMHSVQRHTPVNRGRKWGILHLHKISASLIRLQP